ncbi:MAG TPA: cupin domain-containing protein [Thermoflexia bacterium]|jgi:mannose-6-phosphate isomerase-like protein (cupin superfamily)|nr:cupin domain-containing protein [Thermoflexia bacterium]
MRLEKLRLEDAAQRLTEPFSMIDLATVGDLTVSLYLCQGILAWHRHLDQDELFWVHKGVILLESEQGKVRLRPGELAVVRKGLAHRSSSPLRSTVILVRCTALPNRKNGRFRLYGTTEPGPQRVSLRDAAQHLPAPFEPQTVARVEDAVVQVARGEGPWPLPEVAEHDTLLVTLSGTVIVQTERGTLALRADELTVVPQGTSYMLTTTQDAVLVRLARIDPLG